MTRTHPVEVMAGKTTPTALDTRVQKRVLFSPDSFASYITRSLGPHFVYMIHRVK